MWPLNPRIVSVPLLGAFKTLQQNHIPHLFISSETLQQNQINNMLNIDTNNKRAYY